MKNDTFQGTNSLHLPGCAIPKGNYFLSSKHPFSGAVLVSGRVNDFEDSTFATRLAHLFIADSGLF